MAFLREENSKTREFLHRLSLSNFLSRHTIPKDLINQEVHLLFELREASMALSDGTRSNRLHDLTNYEKAEKDLRSLWMRMGHFDPEYVSLRKRVPISWENTLKCIDI